MAAASPVVAVVVAAEGAGERLSPREVRFSSKDEPLRADVHLYGAMVGDILKEQGGETLYQDVELARSAAIAAREGDASATGELARRLEALSAERSAAVVRAFSIYFQAINLAERVHRIRRRRDYLREASKPQPESLAAAMCALHDQGMSLDALAARLAATHYEPVLTAHPTQATRRTILRKQQRIARAMVDRLRPGLTPQEERAALARIREELTAIWQTRREHEVAPTVADEQDAVQFFLLDVIYQVIPAFYGALSDAMTVAWGDSSALPVPPKVLGFGSWVGGDMDGNPNVDGTTLLEALERQRQGILEAYRREVRELYGLLSQSGLRVTVSADLDARLAQFAADPAADLAGVVDRHRDMPYRVFLHGVAGKLAATLRDTAGAYADPSALLSDLALVADSLEANLGANAGAHPVRRLMRRVDTFGMHLATIDVRQDARVHRKVIAAGLSDAAWAETDADGRQRRLSAALAATSDQRLGDTDETAQVLGVFEAIATAQSRYGTEAIGAYIVSMTSGADDVLTVLLLARWAGLTATHGVPLDVAPLFETLADLEAAPGILEALLSDPSYRAHLRQRSDRQMVMLGYSDSSKDAGMVASRWALHRTQSALAEVARAHDIELIYFHGRGGTVGRGGSRTHSALLSAPPGARGGRQRVTEQGESIDAKFGLRGIATRSLEQAMSAMLLAPHTGDDALEARARPIMETFATAARARYRALLDADGFDELFRAVTPIDVIERMRIGSRPSSRGKGKRAADLRAIPWVFSWTQTRLLLPGWFGVGSGLDAAMVEHGETAVVELARDWPLLNNLLADVAMVLAKSDADMGARYLELAPEPLRPLADGILEEHSLAVASVRRALRSEALLAEHPGLARAIRLRNPYVDPISQIQIELLLRWRAGDREDEALFRALVESVNGIAQGLQNTG